MDRLRRFWVLSRPEKRALCEAGLLLMLSTVCVKSVAFKRIHGFLRSRWEGHSGAASDFAGDITLVSASLSRAANILPWESRCLSRSLAAFIMLRRRGIPAVLVFGVKSSANSSLQAHAWVEAFQQKIGEACETNAFTPLLRIGQEPVARVAMGHLNSHNSIVIPNPTI